MFGGVTSSRYASLTRDELDTLLPELLLIGHMIDRSGMAWCIQAFGREGMEQVAIEEWAGASPVYAQRIQRALNFVGNDVPTIFKGMQFDIGSPPQFMEDRKSTRLNSSHVAISYAVFCLKKTKLYQDDIRAWGRRCE